MGKVIVKDITEERLRQKEEKEVVKGLIKEIFGKKVKIKNRGDYSTLEVKLGKIFRRKVIMHLNFSVGCARAYKKEHSSKYDQFVDSYSKIRKDGFVTLIKDYSGLNLNI